MNHRLSVVTGAALVGIALLSGCGGSKEQAAQKGPVVLKIAHFLPSGASAQQRVLQPWCDTISKESQGRIACQFYPAMQLGGTPAQLADQVKSGVADIVWTAPGYSAGRFPGVETFELPFMVKDATSGSKALWQYYEQNIQKEFADYKVLAFQVDGGQSINTAKKQVTTAADLAGLKLRSSTRLGAKTLTALGASPVAMPPAQVTEAISKGVVDGSLGAWELVVTTKLSEVTKFHAQPAAGQPYATATVLTVLMNKAKYDGLPADLKAIIDKNSGLVLSEKFGQVFDEEATKSRQKVTELGNKVTDLDATQIEAMRKATAGVVDEWIKEVSGKGVDGQKLVDAARALVK